MRIAQRTLLRVGGLRTLLETAAVRYAAEDAGNKLRIIDQAEPVEQLVFLIEIGVHSRVKRVAMFKQFWRISEILRDACARRLWI